MANVTTTRLNYRMLKKWKERKKAKKENEDHVDVKQNKTTEKKSNKRRTEAFFSWLGKFVTKNYKVILIVAVISAGAAIYPALLLQGELKYNDQDFVPQNLESDIGLAILREQFPTNISSETTILVIDSDLPIISEDNIAFINAITDNVMDSEYNEIIAEVISVVSIFNSYLDSYWGEMNATQDLIYSAILENITYANTAMHTAASEIETLYQLIAGFYQMTWFNISRTFFYGNFDADLFNFGPMNSTVVDIIRTNTNFSSGFAVSPEYVQFVYQIVTNSLPDYSLMNDTLLHDITFTAVNSSLYNYLNLTSEEYNQQVYPFLQMYYQNWTNSFTQQITQLGSNIINGSSIDFNDYNNTNLIDAYTSQVNVLGKLASVNYSACSTFNVKDVILSQASQYLSFTDTGFEDYLNMSLLPFLIEQIYDLGPNPSGFALEAFTTNMTSQIMSEIIYQNPPVENLNVFCDNPLFSPILIWVISDDGKSAIIQISYDVSKYGTSEEKDRILVEVDDWIGNLAYTLITEMNLTQTRVYRTGEIFITESIVGYSEEGASNVDIIAAVCVFVVLIILFTSLVAPIVPLLTIGLAIVISFALLYWIAQVMDLHYLSTLLLSIVSMGAGVDYCIFIYSRYTEELKKGKPKEEAVQIAVSFAGESVFHSGLTVLVGFGALIIPNFPMLRCLGIAMIIGISFSILCSLLIVPSLLMLLGNAVFWPKGLNRILRPQKWFKRSKSTDDIDTSIRLSSLSDVPEGSSNKRKRLKPITKETNAKKKESITLRFGKFVTKHGLKFFIISLVAFAPFIYFTVTMDTSTDFMRMLPADFEGNSANEILQTRMGFGNPTPVKILFHNMSIDPFSPQGLKDTDRLCLRIRRLDHVKTIRTSIRPFGGFAISYTNPEVVAAYEEQIRTFIGVDGRTLYMEIYLEVDAYSDEAYHFLKELDGFIDQTIEENEISSFSSSEIYIMGVAQDFLNMKDVTNGSYPIVIPIVIIGVFLILFFLFGSYFTPIRLIITIGMSILFTLGMVNIVYSIGFAVPILWLLPIMMFSILMGLGLDYDIFLVSRIKEYCETGMTDKDAIAHALEHTSTIITSCGLVMAAAFSSLMFSDLWHISELGFAFTLSILLDATLVRLVLVPSIMVLLEKFNWTGPKRLQKIRRNPKVTAVMKVLGDNVSVDIYSKELKEELESVVAKTTDEDPRHLINQMLPSIKNSIESNLITVDLIELMISAVGN